jgi:DNA-directed RNA polymerase delta subunit
MTPSDVYGQLWKDPKYVRLNELKDEALRAWNRADAYKHTAAAVPAEELRRKDEAAKRAMRAVHEYERDAFTKAGVSWGFEV